MGTGSRGLLAGVQLRLGVRGRVDWNARLFVGEDVPAGEVRDSDGWIDEGRQGRLGGTILLLITSNILKLSANQKPNEQTGEG